MVDFVCQLTYSEEIPLCSVNSVHRMETFVFEVLGEVQINDPTQELIKPNMMKALMLDFQSERAGRGLKEWKGPLSFATKLKMDT